MYQPRRNTIQLVIACELLIDWEQPGVGDQLFERWGANYTRTNFLRVAVGLAGCRNLRRAEYLSEVQEAERIHKIAHLIRCLTRTC